MLGGQKGLILALALFGVILLVCGSAIAEIPHKVNYQGRLVDSATGLPLPGSHSMQFRLYAAPAGGSPVWSESLTGAADSSGVVSVILGSTNPIDISFDDPCWLEVEVDGEILSPRTEMVSSPYAFFAADSERLGGLLSSSFSMVGHVHDSRYYTQAELNTSDGSPPNVGSNRLSWKNLVDVPADFADEIDNLGGVSDTANYARDADKLDGMDASEFVDGVSAGAGLSGGGSGGTVMLSVGTGAVTSSMIQDGTVANVDLANNAVNSDKILDGSISTLDLAVDAVNSDKIQDGTVTESDLSFAPGDITSVGAGLGLSGGGASGDVELSVGPSSITSTMIQDGAVSQADLAVDAVNSSKIQDGSVAQSDLSFTPGDITGVSPGSGLDGGGSSGEVTLYVPSGGIGQSHVSGGYVDLSNSQTISGSKTFNSSVDVNSTVYSNKFYITDAGNHNAVNVRNDAPTYPTIWAKNNNSDGSNAVYGEASATDQSAIYAKNNVGNSSYVNGVYANVASTSHYGIGTNGKGYFGGGTAAFTSVESAKGRRLMTSPLVPEVEIYVSGTAELVDGKASVDLPEDLSDIISDSTPILVIVTPAGMCNGIAVTERSRTGFVAQELMNGSSSAVFDWLVIARKSVSVTNREAESMPTVVPTCEPPPVPPMLEEE